MKEAAARAVRAASPADAEMLARLRWEFRSSLEPAAESEEAFVARCARWMADRLRDGRPAGWRSWVAEESGEPVGAIWVFLLEKIPNPVAEPERHAYVSNLYVRPSARRRGLGSALLAAALEACDGVGVDAVILWPTPASLGLYARHGFSGGGDLLERRLPRPAFADPSGEAR